MKPTKRKVSCTFKRETPLEIQERIYLLLKNPVLAVATAGCDDFSTGGSQPITLSEKECARLDANECIFSTAGWPKS